MLTTPSVACSVASLISDKSVGYYSKALIFVNCAKAIVGGMQASWKIHILHGPPGHVDKYRLLKLESAHSVHSIAVLLIDASAVTYRMLASALLFALAGPLIATGWFLMNTLTSAATLKMGTDLIPWEHPEWHLSLFSLTQTIRTCTLRDGYWFETPPYELFYQKGIYIMRVFQASVGIWLIAAHWHTSPLMNEELLLGVSLAVSACLIFWLVAFPAYKHGILAANHDERRWVAYDKITEWLAVKRGQRLQKFPASNAKVSL